MRITRIYWHEGMTFLIQCTLQTPTVCHPYFNVGWLYVHAFIGNFHLMTIWTAWDYHLFLWIADSCILNFKCLANGLHWVEIQYNLFVVIHNMLIPGIIGLCVCDHMLVKKISVLPKVLRRKYGAKISYMNLAMRFWKGT